jgi:hypothetical protein
MTRIPADLQTAIALFTSSLGGSSIPTCEETENNRIPGDYTWESITLHPKKPKHQFSLEQWTKPACCKWIWIKQASWTLNPKFILIKIVFQVYQSSTKQLGPKYVKSVQLIISTSSPYSECHNFIFFLWNTTPAIGDTCSCNSVMDYKSWKKKYQSNEC